MIMTQVTAELLGALSLSVVLGAVIGVCLYRFRAIKRQRGLSVAHKKALDDLKLEQRKASNDRLAAMRAMDAEHQLLTNAREKAKQSVAQQEAIQVHSQSQAQRIQSLESELAAAEERSLCLQSDFASFKANKIRELQMLRLPKESWNDSEELPVLNKRVQFDISNRYSLSKNHNPGRVINAADAMPLIARELDIPSLAESELPDSVDELQFDFAEADGAETSDDG